MNSNFERTLIKVETKATNSTTGTESRPATARTSLVYSSNAKGDQANERKIKLLNKTLKSLRVDISNLQKENNHMKKVRYLINDMICILKAHDNINTIKGALIAKYPTYVTPPGTHSISASNIGIKVIIKLRKNLNSILLSLKISNHV